MPKNRSTTPKTRSASSGQRNSTSSSSPAKRTKKVRQIGTSSYITGGIFALLGLFLGIGYINSDGAFIRLLCNLFKGLLGFGYYVMPPAFLLAACILAFSKKRSAIFRTVCVFLLPVFVGTVFQLIKGIDLSSTTGKINYLWEMGKELKGGGIISGSFSALLKYLLGNIGAWVVTAILSLADLVLALGIPLISIFKPKPKTRKQQKEREQFYEDVKEEIIYGDKEKQQKKREESQPKIEVIQPTPETAVKPELVKKPESMKKTDPNEAIRQQIDIPIDPPRREKKTVNLPGFFNKHSNVKRPDEFLSGEDKKVTEAAIAEVLNNEPTPEFPINDDGQLSIPATGPKASSAAVPSPLSDTEGSPEEAFEDEVEMTAAAASKNEYVFPPIELLSEAPSGQNGDSQDEVRINTIRLENVLKSFGINTEISNVVRGPSVTRYEMELEVGVKLNKLTSLSDDIALALGATGVRISAIPNRISTVGIEVPNRNIRTVYLREIIDSAVFRDSESKLTFAIGKNISGEAIVGNIARLPHLLVAGTTGSGKSVCLNSMILSILYKAKPEEVKFIMIDPKMVEFKVYNGIPHLLVPVVTEAKKASGALQWAVTEMMKRYRLFSETGARDLTSYNAQVVKDGDGEIIPQIVVVIDELADLMLIAAKEVEESICRIAQMGRAAGVHLVIATQSPRADVITGLMKANIPSRIAFKVASALESRIILDSGGNADKLVGNGDMLFAPIGTSRPDRIQGAWVTDDERESIVEFVKKSGNAEYSEEIINEMNRAAEDKKAQSQSSTDKPPEDSDMDVMFSQAVDVVLDMGQASVSMLQRRLKLGYSRAARLVDQMEEKGIVGPFEGSKPRQVLITKQQWQEMQFIQGTAPITPVTRDSGQTMESADDLFEE